MRAAFHLSVLRSGDTARAAIVVDSDTGIRVATVAALLYPWRSWLEINDVLVTDTTPGDGWLDIVVANGSRRFRSSASDLSLPVP
jgi:hypothetical protein